MVQTSLLRPALQGVAFFGLICAALVTMWSFLPAQGADWYPSLWLRLAAISPLFFASRLSPAVFQVLRRRMDGRARLSFALFFCLGVGLVGRITESAVIFLRDGAALQLGLADILLQPFSARYSLTVFADIGFASAAVLAAGFVALLSVPIRVLSLEQAEKAAQKATSAADQDSR